MKKLAIIIPLMLSGCAFTHEQLVERAHNKSNAELCMALIKYPQLSDIINAELQSRGQVCDVSLAAAQVRYEQQAQQQASAAQLALAAQLLDAGAPRTLAPAPAPAPVSAGGIVGFLRGQSTSGTLRYCTYSNGVVNTINITDLCPLQTK